MNTNSACNIYLDDPTLLTAGFPQFKSILSFPVLIHETVTSKAQMLCSWTSPYLVVHSNCSVDLKE